MQPKTFAALFLATLCLTPGLAHAAKPVTETPVKVTIDNTYAGAAVTGVGGAYVDGMNGVHARIMTASGDLLIDFDTPERYLMMNWSYDVTSAIRAGCTSPFELNKQTSWPTEPFPTQPYVSFDSIGLLKPGESRSSGVVFNTQYGRARLKHRINPQNDYCAGYLRMTRVNETDWVIESPQNPNPGASHDGIAVILQEYVTSIHPYTTELRAVAYVNLPFRFLVTTKLQ